jgi:signal transduction histidine kinase
MVIPPAIRSQVFEPFVTTKKDVGTGLGIWVCKSIVERHGGKIHTKSST